jgi:predicted nucleotide-binding protein
MTNNKNKIKVSSDEIHAFLEKTLIEAYLKGKGYTLEDLKALPEAEARQLMEEASTMPSNKLAEVELRAHFVHELHDAYALD